MARRRATRAGSGVAPAGRPAERRRRAPRLPRGAASPESGMRPNRDSSRSDDWTTGDGPANIEQAFDELETGALTEIARFQQDCEDRRRRPIPAHAMRILDDCFAGRLTDTDRIALGVFVPGVLRETLALGDWKARLARHWRRCAPARPDWPVEEFCAGAVRPASGCDAARGGGAGWPGCAGRGRVSVADPRAGDARGRLADARAGGERTEGGPAPARARDRRADRRPAGTDHSLAHRRPLVRGSQRGSYPGLDRWRTSHRLPRWFPSQHPEVRVRQEVVAALSQASSEGRTADPDGDAGRRRGAAVHRHPAPPGAGCARLGPGGLLGLLRDENFAHRSEPERRALLRALATRGDAVLPRARGGAERRRRQLVRAPAGAGPHRDRAVHLPHRDTGRQGRARARAALGPRGGAAAPAGSPAPRENRPMSDRPADRRRRHLDDHRA